MATLGVHFSDEEESAVRAAAEAAGQKASPYAAQAIRERMRREGHVPGTPAFDLRTEVVAAAEVAGPERVMAALRDLRNGREAAA